MKYRIRITLLIGLISISQLALSGSITDTYNTGDTLTTTTLDNIKDAVNDNNTRINDLVNGQNYAIGDIGPAGGWVFYIEAAGLHGLEAATVDQSAAAWGCNNTNIVGADGTRVGMGARNTDDIIRGCLTLGIAAALADDYISVSGYNDWFLPSKDELNLMYLNIGPGSMALPNLGGFVLNNYWSSSELNNNNAWAQDFGNGIQSGTPARSNPFVVRSVRAF